MGFKVWEGKHKRAESNLLADEIGPHDCYPVSCLGYTSCIFIHLLFRVNINLIITSMTVTSHKTELNSTETQVNSKI